VRSSLVNENNKILLEAVTVETKTPQKGREIWYNTFGKIITYSLKYDLDICEKITYILVEII